MSKLDDITISLTIGSNTMYKNGEGINLDVPAQVLNNRTLVPIRAVSEAFGADVSWIDQTKSVIIYYVKNYGINNDMNLHISSSDEESFTLTWNVVDGAKGYVFLSMNEPDTSDFMLGLGYASAEEGASTVSKTFSWDMVKSEPYVAVDALAVFDPSDIATAGGTICTSNILYLGDKIPKNNKSSIEGHYELTSLTANGATVTKKGNEKFFEDLFGKDCYINLEQNGKVQMKFNNTSTEGTYTDSKIMNIFDYTIDGDNLNIHVNSNGIDNICIFTKTK